jgi:uncharacterized OsmC-like protein
MTTGNRDLRLPPLREVRCDLDERAAEGRQGAHSVRRSSSAGRSAAFPPPAAGRRCCSSPASRRTPAPAATASRRARPGRCSRSPTAAGSSWQPPEHTRNGVATLDLIKEQPELARFQFRASNRWHGGAHNRSTIRGFYAAGGEDATRTADFQLDAGEPQILLGADTGPNPAEFLLHALAACLTTSIVYVAAARKVRLTSVESVVVGDMDVRGALGVDPGVRNGFERIGVAFRISGDAPEDKLREVAERGRVRSAVYDMVTNGVPVELTVTTA